MINKFPTPWHIVTETRTRFDTETGEPHKEITYWIKDANNHPLAFFHDRDKHLAEIIISGHEAYFARKAKE